MIEVQQVLEELWELGGLGVSPKGKGSTLTHHDHSLSNCLLLRAVDALSKELAFPAFRKRAREKGVFQR